MTYEALDAEYPKAIYRDGGPDLIWGKPIETSVASSREEEVEALSKGWRLHPIAPEEKSEGNRRGRPPKEKAEE